MTQKQKYLNKIIHPNRYFIWAIVFVVVSFAALFSYIHVTSLRLDTESTFSNEKTYNRYIDEDNGFSIKYPASWYLDYDPSGNIVFENPNDLEESVVVTTIDLDMEGVIRHSIDILSEENFKKENMDISVMTVQSARDGSVMDVAIIKTGSKLYYLSGNTDRFPGFVNNFKAF